MSAERDWLDVAWAVLLVFAFTAIIGSISVHVLAPETSTYVAVAIAIVVSAQVRWPSCISEGGGT